MYGCTDRLKSSSPLSQLDRVFDKCEGGGGGGDTQLRGGCIRDFVGVDGQVRSAYATLWELRWIYLPHPSGINLPQDSVSPADEIRRRMYGINQRCVYM